MKFKYLLLLAFSVWLVGVTAAIAAPLRAVNRFTANRSITAIRFTPDPSTLASNTYRNCQTTSPAVVTVYAGNETGSGSIVGSEGLVITSNHVVSDRDGQPVIARTSDGRQYRGQVIKTDTRNDLALIRLNAQEQFPTVPLASVRDLQIGQSVCAIGSPYGRPGVLSEGTLSLVRNNGDLQANIRLYPGNSGGPLLNPQGALIGVNKAILESPSGRNTGISFATSVQAVRNLIGQPEGDRPSVSLPETQRSEASPQPFTAATPEPTVTEWTWGVPEAKSPVPNPQFGGSTAPKGRLGVTLDVLNLVVQQVQSGSVADIGGLRSGDRLVAINGQQLDGFDALQAFLDRQPSTAMFTLDRDQQLTNVQVNF